MRSSSVGVLTVNRVLKQFFQFLHEKRSKSDTSEDSISFSTWLGELLGTDAGSIKQELEVSLFT